MWHHAFKRAQSDKQLPTPRHERRNLRPEEIEELEEKRYSKQNIRKIHNGKSVIKWKKQKLKHIKGMNNNCHIPNLVQVFSYVEIW